MASMLACSCAGSPLEVVLSLRRLLTVPLPACRWRARRTPVRPAGRGDGRDLTLGPGVAKRVAPAAKLGRAPAVRHRPSTPHPHSWPLHAA